MDNSEAVLERLEAVIRRRRDELPEGSYTTRLVKGGVRAIGAKVAEEAEEVVEAAGEPGVEGERHLVREAADLMYHLLVLLSCRDVRLADVAAELAHREGVSGLAEKAARKGTDSHQPDDARASEGADRGHD
ncbi:MAG: phosphoribosyl-ATP diphosphatase [Pirellulales bacterium]